MEPLLVPFAFVEFSSTSVDIGFTNFEECGEIAVGWFALGPGDRELVITSVCIAIGVKQTIK